MSSTPTILVVDDDHDVADLYTRWVEDDYEVRTAYSGEDALEQADEAVDIVLLDRHMPEVTGDDVVARLRDRGLDCWVIMVTAVDPGLDIVDLDIDDYVTKPVTRSQLVRIIENLRVESKYIENGRRELGAISNKMESLESDSPLENVESTEAYQELEDDLKTISDALVEAFGAEGVGVGESDEDEE